MNSTIDGVPAHVRVVHFISGPGTTDRDPRHHVRPAGAAARRRLTWLVLCARHRHSNSHAAPPPMRRMVGQAQGEIRVSIPNSATPMASFAVALVVTAALLAFIHVRENPRQIGEGAFAVAVLVIFTGLGTHPRAGIPDRRFRRESHLGTSSIRDTVTPVPSAR